MPGGSTTTSGGKTTPTGTGTDGSVCPANWRLPTAREIANLIGYTGSITGTHSGTAGTYTGPGGETIVSAKGTGGWNFTVSGATLFFPFAGYYGGSNSGTIGIYWSSTEGNAARAYYLQIHSGYTYGSLDWYSKSGVYSVRCVRSK